MQKKPPIDRIRVGNGIRASIWENESKNGSWLSVTIDRSYKDGGDKTQYSTRFTKNDLLFVAKAAEMAFSWCLDYAEKAKRETEQE